MEEFLFTDSSAVWQTVRTGSEPELGGQSLFPPEDGQPLGAGTGCDDSFTSGWPGLSVEAGERAGGTGPTEPCFTPLHLGPCRWKNWAA